MRMLCSSVLALQAIVLGLFIPAVAHVGETSHRTAAEWVGAGLAIACIVLIGFLRHPWAYRAGWVIEGATIACGFVVPVMFILGVVFALLWYFAIRLGRMEQRSG
jgi:hypothetical protein